MEVEKEKTGPKLHSHLTRFHKCKLHAQKRMRRGIPSRLCSLRRKRPIGYKAAKCNNNNNNHCLGRPAFSERPRAQQFTTTANLPRGGASRASPPVRWLVARRSGFFRARALGRPRRASGGFGFSSSLSLGYGSGPGSDWLELA